MAPRKIFLLLLIYQVHKVFAQVLIASEVPSQYLARCDMLKEETKALHELLKDEIIHRMDLVQTIQNQNKLISNMENEVNAIYRTTADIRFDLVTQTDSLKTLNTKLLILNTTFDRRASMLARDIRQEERKREKEMEDLTEKLIYVQPRTNHTVSNQRRGDIAFSVKNAKLSSSGIISFQSISINVGNGYDKISGTFRAPSTGVYVLHWTLVIIQGTECTTVMLVNEEMISWNWGGSSDNSGSQTIIRKLYKGDQVKIKPNTPGSCTQIHSAWSSFSGFRYA